MIPETLYRVANHLWQSTLFAVLAAALTLALRKNSARVRHWIWVAAALKFLVPFSVLIALGSQIPWRTAVQTAAHPVSMVLDDVSQPFTAPAGSFAPAEASPGELLPVILLGAWALGLVAVACSWWIRARRIRAAIRAGSPLPLSLPIPAVSSPSFLEPGIFGVFRPVLLLPEGIFEHLTAEQWKTVIAHELCHVRHRDNLVGALQMLVETVFWFHPLVWWIGKRIFEERERACDEEVLRLGNEPRAYARGILKVCEVYLVSPQECVAGVSGANLRRRIEDIMTNRVSQKLNFGRKALLACLGVFAFTAPVVIGIDAPRLRAQSKAPQSFEVVSIKPFQGDARDLRGPEFLPGGRFTSRAPLLIVIATAYNLPFQNLGARLTGVPNWANVKPNSTEGVYDIEAKAADGAIPSELSPKGRADRMRLMLQALLADRFKMVVRHEIKELPIYVLVVGKGGPKLPKADIQEKDCPDTPLSESAANVPCHRFTGGRGRGFHGRAVDMTDLVAFAQNWTDRPLFDKTGLNGLYKIDTEPFQPMELTGTAPAPGTKQDGVDLRDLPTLFTVFERLGLRMESQKGPVDTYTVEHIEKPAEN